MIKIGIIREGKTPVDRRVVLLPEQCIAIEKANPEVKIFVQSSVVRCVKDEAYMQLGLPILENVETCDILLGVKEVPIKDLIPEKTYFFFSHTIKKQAYNKPLLRAILEKNIRLIDYECLTDDKGERIIAFGRYAGIVGAYNAIRTWGLKYQLFELHRAIDCVDYEDLLAELQKVTLPPIKIAVTGRGRSGGGTLEVLKAMHIKQVSAKEYLEQNFDEPVFVHLASSDYYKPKQASISFEEFYDNPQLFETDFLKFAYQTDLFISTHYWNPKAPKLFEITDTQSDKFRIKVVADITCDIDGSIPTTLRASTIADPLYDFNPNTLQEERVFTNTQNITVMAVDNLPTELPFGASKDFGEQFIKEVLPQFFNGDKNQVLERATIAQNGKLSPYFTYLQDFVNE
ncbi:MAG: NAD(P)-dependent oxidoreductase [Thermonemataceae bacterium]|nr:NAD(P)-dependent oxidoreductase [Thermonemataceae bacterium]